MLQPESAGCNGCKVRLLDGARFDVGFTIGLAKSLVFVPLMSLKCMKSFTELGVTDRCDFALAEAAAEEPRSSNLVSVFNRTWMGERVLVDH